MVQIHSPRPFTTMAWFVYILRSERDGKRYIGCTSDVSARLARHNRGEVQATRHRRPLQLVHTERFESRSEAFAREKFLKTWAGRIELGKILGSGPEGG